jgi:L-cysteine:1D-myo-inositol 2-amino-2-deoxy-alpha-D-glucopyranoside ligase
MKLYNTLSGKIEEFKPLKKGRVKMYVCGITPYDTTHLGHAFTYIFFDSLNRYLRLKKFDLTYTQNVTDINDRDEDILMRAKEQGVPWYYLADFWTDKFLHDMHLLNWIMPDNFLWASAHMPTMIDLIKKLLENGYAYETNGGIYYNVTKKSDYGKLSNFSKEQMLKKSLEFAEDINNPDKRNPLDITLWKPTKKDQPEHIPSFESPFGPGRPGWHIECSAMAQCSLGDRIDIHGGGSDLIYPHHESEIAQSEGASEKKPFAKYWLHTGAVSYKGEKMSKSIGNLILISDLLQTYSPNAIRYLLLSHHYRKPWDFKTEELIKAEESIAPIHRENINKLKSTGNQEEKLPRQFLAALDNDMNTPEALNIMLESKNKEDKQLMAEVLGFTI